MQTDNNFSLFDTCEHLNTCEGFCESCGMDVGPRIITESNYSDICMYIPKTETRTYDDELNKIEGLSMELKSKVSETLNKDKCTGKEVTRKIDVFKQVYVTGAEINELNPEVVLKSLNLSRKNINETLRDISGTGKKNIKDQKGEVITCPVASISTFEYLKKICDIVPHLKEHHNNIKLLLEKCILKSQSLLNSKPQHLAAGCAKLYCQVNGLPHQNMSSQIDLPNQAISQYVTKLKKVCELHNIDFDML